MWVGQKGYQNIIQMEEIEITEDQIIELEIEEERRYRNRRKK